MRPVYVLPFFLAACGSPTVTGTLTHGLSGEPLADTAIVLQAPSDASLSCQRFEAQTGPDGAFSIAGPCVPGTEYSVRIDGMQVFDGARVSSAEVGTIEAFPAPDGSGVFELSAAGELTSIRTHADVRTENLWQSEEVVEFPSVMPIDADTPHIQAGEYLVLLGNDIVLGAQVQPLVPSEGRKFGTPEQFVEMAEPWWYVGIEFTSDTEYTHKQVLADPAQVIDKRRGDTVVRYIPASALPEGRYSIREPGSRRMAILRVGG